MLKYENIVKVETDLLNEIASLQLASTGHQHEGSVYGARKDFDLARMQINLVANQLGALREALASPVLPTPHPEEIDSDDSDEDDNDDHHNLNNCHHNTRNGIEDRHQHSASQANGRSNGGASTNGTDETMTERVNGHGNANASTTMDINGAN